jgi:hypothetical protein
MENTGSKACGLLRTVPAHLPQPVTPNQMSTGSITRRESIRLLALAPAAAMPPDSEWSLLRVRCTDEAAKLRVLALASEMRAQTSQFAVFEAIAAAHLPEILLVGSNLSHGSFGNLPATEFELTRLTVEKTAGRRLCRQSGDTVLEICRYGGERETMEFRLFRSLGERAARWVPPCDGDAPIEISLYRAIKNPDG